MSSGLVLPCSSRLTECLGRLPSTTSLSDLRALLSREFGLATAAGGSRELTQEEEAVVFVMETAVKMELQPDELVRQIRQAGLSREWAEVLGEFLNQNGKRLLEKARNHSIGGFPMAEKTQWRVDMVLSSSDRDKIQEPVATFDIHLGDGQEPISFEAGEKELETLFKDLERIQRQLDSIS